MTLKRKDLLTIRELEADEIRLILQTADSMKEIASREIKKGPALRGKTIINPFYDASTPPRPLLYLFTIRERLECLEGLRVAIVGDISHSRVARSNILAMQKMGMEVRIAGPATLLPRAPEQLGVQATTSVEAAIAGGDVIMLLRTPRERRG